MKLAIVVLCMLPLVFAEKRVFLDSLLDLTEVKKLVDNTVQQFGTDATEQQCESECTTLFTNNLLDQGCDVLCLSFQSLVKKFYHPNAAMTPSA